MANEFPTNARVRARVRVAFRSNTDSSLESSRRNRSAVAVADLSKFVALFLSHLAQQTERKAKVKKKQVEYFHELLASSTVTPFRVLVILKETTIDYR